MFKVFVVEDEPFILKTIKQMIGNANLNFEIVGDAYNGEVALPLIRDSRPDIVFTDIKMPVMDGLALIQNLRESNPDIVTVVISGFQEFDYARQSLQLGVYDYLLKPLSSQALENLLKRIHAQLKAKEKESRNELLELLINNINPSQSFSKGKLTDLFAYTGYQYMLLCAGSYCTFPSLWLTPAKEFWIKNDPETLLANESDAGNAYWVLDGEHDNEKIIVAGYTGEEGRSEVKNKLVGIHSHLAASGFPLTSVIRHAGTKITEIAPLLQVSRIILNKSIRFAGSRLIDGDKSHMPSSGEKTVSLDKNSEKLLDLLIQNHQEARFKEELNKLFRICETTAITQLNLERILKQILGMFFNSVDIIPDGRTEEIEMEVNELISNSTSYKSLGEGFHILIDDLFRLKKNKTEMEESQTVLAEKVEQYIKANFCNPVNLQSMADYFHVAPQHLSRTYKRIKGLTPNNYIIELRIEKTKELLLIKPPIVLKEIAEAVGFNDPFYLSKVFKSVTGKSPSEFRA